MEENKKDFAADAAENAPEAEETKKEKKHQGAQKDKEELRKLRAEVEELRKKAADAEDKYMRVAAEYDNFRKRTAKERDGIYADATADALKSLMPLLDNLERASAYTESDKLAEGVKMILGSLPDVLTKMNVTRFGAPGDKFDPNLHNAIMHVDDESLGENEITDVLQCGYMIGDKVIRYAMVRVAN